MNVEKLEKMAASVRTGGKGSVRRKKKNAGHNNKTDDKKRLLKTTTGGSNGKQQPSVEEFSKSKTRDDESEDIASDDDSDFAAHENFAERPLSRGYAHDARRRFELLRKPVRGPPPVVLETLAHMKSSGELDRLTKALFGSFPRPEDRAC